MFNLYRLAALAGIAAVYVYGNPDWHPFLIGSSVGMFLTLKHIRKFTVGLMFGVLMGGN